MAHDWLEAIADPTRLHIMSSLVDGREAKIADLQVEGTSPQTLRRHLTALVATGVITERPGKSDGETPGRPASHFQLAPGIRDGLSPAMLASIRQVQQHLGSPILLRKTALPS